MKKALILILTFYITTPCGAYFDKLTPQARPAGMAYAFTALATDLNAVRYNPAGLALLPYAGINFSYSSPFPNLRDGSLFKDTELTAGYPLIFSKGDKEGHGTNLGTVAISYRSSGVGGRYTEETLTLSFARETFKDLYFGLNLNQFNVKYGPGIYAMDSVDTQGNLTGVSDPLFTGGKSKSGTGIDMGLSYILTIRKSNTVYDRYCFAVSGDNIVSSGLNLGSEETGPPVRTRLALGYNHSAFKIDCEYVRTEVSDSITDSRYSLGAERWFSLKDLGRTAVRSGLSVGSESSSLISMGFSYLFRFYMLDYAYIMPVSGYEDVGGDHQISFSLRFGKVDMDLEPNPILRKKIEERRKLNKALKRLKSDTVRQKKEIKKLKGQLVDARESMPEMWDRRAGIKDTDRNSYIVSIDLYRKMVSDEAAYSDRRIYLKNLIKDYEDKAIDISQAETEFEKVERVLDNGRKNMKMSWSYYRRLIERGSDKRARRRVLFEMKRKYKYLGFDMSDIDKELKKIERMR